MTRAELEARLARKVREIEPAIAQALLAAVAAIRNAASLAAIERLIERGQISEILTLLTNDADADAALRKYSNEMRKAFNIGGVFAEPQVRRVRVRTFVRTTLPPARLLANFHYDYLNPRVIEAIRAYQGVGLSAFTEGVAGGIRAVLEEGLQAGVHPRTTAIQLRELVGLSEHGARAVLNYRRMLLGGPRSGVFSRALNAGWSDRRFDGIISRAIISGDKLTPEQIDRFVAAYERKARAAEALTIARTNAHDALKASQRGVWAQAVDEGRVEAGLMTYTWNTARDERVRPEHAEMQGATRSHDGAYPNGDAYPGESSYNCRCFETARVG